MIRRLDTAIPRLLHPGAWWLWALGLAVAASRTLNPLLLVLIGAVAMVVVAQRRVPGPWSRSYWVFLQLGLAVIAIRVVLEVLIGGADIGSTMIELPEVPLPTWLAGVRLGGVVTWDGFWLAVCDGLRLAVMLACVGAANSLVNPSRLLRIVPAALYEAGVAVVVCLSLAPVLVTDLGRLRRARRLRGRTSKGPRAWGQLALALFAGALERSVDLAAAMDARGYGRAEHGSAVRRRWNAILVVLGLLGVFVGLYGLLDGGSPDVAGAALIGWPMLGAGAALAAAGSLWAGRRVSRTRYRPDPWRAAEWLTVGCGMAPAVVFLALRGDTGVGWLPSPPILPGLPPAALVALALAVLPGFVTPRVPGSAVTAAAEVRPKAGSERSQVLT